MQGTEKTTLNCNNGGGSHDERAGNSMLSQWLGTRPAMGREKFYVDLEE